MGRGGALEDVERFALDDPSDMSEMNLAQKKKMLQTFLDSHSELGNQSSKSKFLASALASGDDEEFVYNLSLLVSDLEPSTHDRLLRQKLYPLIYSEEELSELEDNLQKATEEAGQHSSVQTVWFFDEAPDAFKQFSEDAELDDFVVLHLSESLNTLAFEIPLKGNRILFLSRQLNDGSHLFYMRKPSIN
jgi:hypothetical protein